MSYLYEPERAPLITFPADILASLSFQGGMTEADYQSGGSTVADPQVIIGRASRFPVTGIVDESSNRFATYVYDIAGRAVSTERANGVFMYQFFYASPLIRTSVTDPLGSVRTLNFAVTAQTLTQTSLSQPGGSGCGPASAAVTYDTNANVMSRTDFNGQDLLRL